jgi:tetratricopeptide (TPR) repeat protein
MSTVTVKELHDQAMALSSRATLARIRGDLDEAREFARQALPYEAKAAAMLFDRLDAEPSRSVLYRSAASLALQCGEYEEAERLIATGLAGHPPDEIAAELRDLLAEVKEQKGGPNDALLPQTRKHPA